MRRKVQIQKALHQINLHHFRVRALAISFVSMPMPAPFNWIGAGNGDYVQLLFSFKDNIEKCGSIKLN